MMFESNIYARWLLYQGQKLGLDRDSFERYAMDRGWDFRPLIGCSPWEAFEGILDALRSRVPSDMPLSLFLLANFNVRPFESVDRTIGRSYMDMGSAGHNAIAAINGLSTTRDIRLWVEGDSQYCCMSSGLPHLRWSEEWTNITTLTMIIAGEALHGTNRFLQDVWLSGKQGAPASDYETLLNTPVEFGSSSTRTRYDGRMLSAPSSCSAEGSSEELLKFVRRRLQRKGLPALHRAYRVSRNRSGSTKEVLRLVADDLGIAPRMLQLALKKEGTCLRELWEIARSDLSLGLLSDPAVTIRGASRVLGFSDVATFQRAFKKWFQMTPREYQLMMRKSIQPVSESSRVRSA